MEAYSEGEYEKAMKCFSTALKTQRLTLGVNDICIAHTLENYGDVCVSAGKNDEAVEVLKECLQMKLELRAKEPKSKDYVISITDTLNNLGNAAFLRGNNKSAMAFYQHVINEIKYYKNESCCLGATAVISSLFSLAC